MQRQIVLLFFFFLISAFSGSSDPVLCAPENTVFSGTELFPEEFHSPDSSFTGSETGFTRPFSVSLAVRIVFAAMLFLKDFGSESQFSGFTGIETLNQSPNDINEIRCFLEHCRKESLEDPGKLAITSSLVSLEQDLQKKGLLAAEALSDPAAPNAGEGSFIAKSVENLKPLNSLEETEVSELAVTFSQEGGKLVTFSENEICLLLKESAYSFL